MSTIERTEEQKLRYRQAIESIRTRLREYAYYHKGKLQINWSDPKDRARIIRGGAAAVTALHNVYLDIRGKKCRRHCSPEYFKRWDYQLHFEKFSKEFEDLLR